MGKVNKMLADNTALNAAALGITALLLWAAVSWPAYAASGKNGVSPNAVVKPSGPGSIQGMGEGFQPELFTGTATYAFGVRVPKNASDLEPSIALEYDGGFGNGILGFGWELSVPSIERKTSTGIPRYIDGPNGIDDNGDGVVDEPKERDRFVNPSGDNMTPLPGGVYFNAVEGDFIRYRFAGSHWEADLPGGELLHFGVSENARVYDPETGRVFAWRLERETDTSGNVIQYFYRQFPGADNQNQSYLERIEYGAGPPPWDNFHIVRFDYEARSDTLETGRPGFLVRTGMRLTGISVSSQGPLLDDHAQVDLNGDSIPDNLNSRYELAYDAHPHWSMLSSILQYGADGVSTLPPVTFTYTASNDDPVIDATDAIVASQNAPLHVMDSDRVGLSDLNGDGLADILQTDPAGGFHSAYLNEGIFDVNGEPRLRWSGRKTIGGDQRVYNVSLDGASGVGAYLSDLNADKRSDLVYKVGGHVYFFPNMDTDGNPEWGERQRLDVDPSSPVPSMPYDAADTQTADIDGNKHADIIQSINVGNTAYYRIWHALSAGKYARTVTVPNEGGYLFTSANVGLSDVNGDDLPDLTRLTPNSMDVKPGLGYGVFGAERIMTIPDTQLTPEQQSAADFDDIDGDGLSDLIIVVSARDEVWFYQNLGNYSFAPRRIITGVRHSESADVDWADLNGNGTADIVISDRITPDRIYLIDIGQLLGCVPAANLLTDIDNGIGRITTISYEMSTAFRLADTRAGNPWTLPMPITLEVVSQIDVDDTLGYVDTTTLAYRNGYYELDGLYFTGFEEVTQTEVGGGDAPSLVTEFIFDTGSVVYPFFGKVLKQTVRDTEGNVFWIQTSTYENRLLYTGIDERTVEFPFKSSSVRETIERGTGTPVITERIYDYDNYGNEILQAKYGIVVDGDRAAGNDEEITHSTYTINTVDWQINYPRTRHVENFDGTDIERTATFYDDATFSGENLGEIDGGAKTMVWSWYDPNDEEAYVISERIEYDDYGNVTGLLDALAESPGGLTNPEMGHYRQIAYDGFNAFPVLETIHLGAGKAPLTVEAEYDPGLGTVLRATNFNGQSSRYTYTPFGLLASTIEPGDSEEFPSAEYEYVLAEPFGDGLISYVETRLLDQVPDLGRAKRDQYFISRSYLDGLGRARMDKSEAENDPDSGAPRVAVSGAARFNDRGEVEWVLQPFYTLAAPPGSVLDDLLAYEDLGAPNWQGHFEVDGALTPLRFADAPKAGTFYDATLRVIRNVNPDGSERSKTYEPYLIHSYDENDNDSASPHFDTPNSHFINGRGWLTRTEERVRMNLDGTSSDDVVSYITHFSYTPDGTLARLTDALGNEKWFEYDGLGRVTYMNDMNRGAISYEYDAVGNLVSRTDAKGQRRSYTYDGVNRPLTEDYHDESEVFSAGRAYDPALPISADNRPDVQYIYDSIDTAVDLGDGTSEVPSNAAGRLVGIVDLAGEEYSSFDARGRTRWVVKRLPGPGGIITSFKTATDYDLQGRVTAITYPDGDRCEYEYNTRNLIERIHAGALDLLVAVDYSPAEQRGFAALGNGIDTRYAYDARGRLTQLTSGKAGSLPLLENRYRFDPVSNILGIEDRRPVGVADDADPRRNSQVFGYDALNRLTGASYSFNVPDEETRDDGTITFRHDALGNLLEQRASWDHREDGIPLTEIGLFSYGGEAGTEDRIGRDSPEPGPHAVTSIENGGTREFAYDANGNVTEMDGISLTWDYRDRLVAAESDGNRAEYVYDHTGRRVMKQVWDKTTPDAEPATVVYPGRHFELRAGGEATKYVLNGKDRIARVTGHLNADVPKIQRIPLHSGWNLRAIAVEADDSAQQLISGFPAVEAAYLYTGGSPRFIAIESDTELPGGSICWIRATADFVLPLWGAPAASAREDVTANGFFAWLGPEVLDLDFALPEVDDEVLVWAHDADDQTWRTRISGKAALSDLPGFLPPGTPINVAAATALDLALPPVSAQIHYYLEDHIGSTSIIADAEGELVRETAYYPYGEPRHTLDTEAAAGVSVSPYAFMQKERDAETGLHYFKHRYLYGALARFNRVDPAVEKVPDAALGDPQLLHAYAYGRNNPITYTDPEGQFPKLGKKESIAARLLDPFGDTQQGNDTSKAARRKNVFGELKIDKKGKLSEGRFVPPAWQDQIDGVKAGAVGPNQLISNIAQVSNKLKNQFDGKDKKNRLDADQLLNVILQKPDLSEAGKKQRLDKFFDLGGKVMAGGDLSDSPITDDGKLVNEDIAKQIEVFQNSLKSIDLDAKFKEFKAIADKEGNEFKFDQKEVDAFIDKYLENNDDKNEKDAEDEKKKKKGGGDSE